MKQTILLVLAVLTLSACSHKEKFTVEGQVTDAEGRTLYFEAASLEGIIVLDSVKLKSTGRYSFRAPRPESPDYYRLRLGSDIINIAIDSTETLHVDAPAEGFATLYTTDDPGDNTRIKELVLKQARLQSDVNALMAAARNRVIGMDVYNDSIRSIMNAYKDDVKRNYIFPDPTTKSAYFALFQRINDLLIFDPLNDKNDIRCFAAVATSLDLRYPHAARSRNLYNIAIKGMKNSRQPRERVLEIPAEKVNEAGVIDITLRDMQGVEHSLTELKGQVVLLDFTAYKTTVSATHNYLLRDLYDKYAAQGLVIYQISLDDDLHYWKTTADNLPWICVRDDNGLYSTNMSAYSVKELPTVFLINRSNELSARVEDFTTLDEAVKALL